MSRRVVITGMGVTSPLGNTVETFWDALCTGTSGIDYITAFDTEDYPCKIAGEVKDVDFSNFVDPKEVRRLDRVILLAMVAAYEAIKQSGITDSSVNLERVGTIIGSGIGGLASLEVEHEKLLKRGPGRVSPFLIPMMIPDMPAGRVSIEYGLKGPNYATVSACASGAHSIGDAFMLIKCGMADAMITGGTEAVIRPVGVAGFCSMKALSLRNDAPQKASSPFDIKRDGFVMGEGAGILVLESLEHALARNATIYGELVGYGASGDAHHLSHPAPEGAGAQAAIKMALSSAGLTPMDIGYINTHGTSTPLNDKYETCAIKAVFGEYVENVAISSTKSMTGHLLGASGAVECIASIMAINNSCIPPTINYEDPDPECDLDYTPNVARKKKVRYALSNSFGFGGHNAALVLGKYDAQNISE
ncbi:beta-ketoacyl-ACP synthase II [bacterium]|nr:beta-ketoacyl-ACP synthase II [candidate division CSSED10-310 bacterium]